MEKKSRITTIGSHNCYNISMLFLVIIILITLAGCGGYRTHITLLNKDLVVTEPLQTGEIKFLDKFPSRNYEVLGKVYADAMTGSGAAGLATIDELIIKKANIIGADAVVHMHYGKEKFFGGGKWMRWGSGLAIKYIETKAKRTSLDFVVIIEEPVVTVVSYDEKVEWGSEQMNKMMNEDILFDVGTIRYSLEAHGYYAVVKSLEEDIYLDLKMNGDNLLELLSEVAVIPTQWIVSPDGERSWTGKFHPIIGWSCSLVNSSKESLWECSECNAPRGGIVVYTWWDGFDSLKPIYDIEDSENLRLDPMVRD